MKAELLRQVRELTGAMLACSCVTGEVRRGAVLLQIRAEGEAGLSLGDWLNSF